MCYHTIFKIKMFLPTLSSRGLLIKGTKTLLCLCRARLLSSSLTESDSKAGGYAEAFKKFQTINEPPTEQPQTFASLLKNSKFIDLGDPVGKVVTGRIFHIVNDDLYIDFGWKFHCICTRPKKNPSNYIRGTKVRLHIKDLELSTKFLGYDKDLTLLEADCQLLGLVQERR